jgi:molybdopterin synthase catalytic subunit
VQRATIQDTPLDVQELMDLVVHAGVGGTAIFVGSVRDHDDERGVAALSYSQHPQAMQVLQEVAAEVAAAFPEASLAVAHRVGDLEIGDLAVVAVAGCPHRDQAFAAARQLIDHVKATVPIWKHQRFADGSDEWVGLP